MPTRAKIADLDCVNQHSMVVINSKIKRDHVYFLSKGKNPNTIAAERERTNPIRFALSL